MNWTPNAIEDKGRFPAFVTMGSRGQFTIPIDLRRKVGLQPGDRLSVFFSRHLTRVMLTPSSRVPSNSEIGDEVFSGTATINAKGQVVLLQKLRAELGVRPGDELAIVEGASPEQLIVQRAGNDGVSSPSLELEGHMDGATLNRRDLPYWEKLGKGLRCAVGEAVGTDIFAGMPPEDGIALQDTVRERHFARGEVVIYEGDEAEAIYLVRSGLVRSFRTSEDGREQTIELLPKGGVFNDVSVLAGSANVASVEAVEDSVIGVLGHRELDSLIDRRPAIAKAIIRHLARQLRYVSELASDLSFNPVRRRVAKILLDHVGCDDLHRLSRAEIAAMAGTAREVVGRELHVMERMDLVRLGRGRITVVDRRGLERLVQARGSTEAGEGS